MKIGILGAGAVGGYFGGLLLQSGHEVGFVVRGETRRRLGETGLILIDADSRSTTAHPTAVAETFTELHEQLGGVDVIIIATKSLPGNDTFGTDLHAEQLRDVPIVTTQNSVEVHYLAAKEFGYDRVLAGAVRGYMTHLEPAKVQLNPGPLSLNFGLLRAGGELSERTVDIAQQLREALQGAGIHSKVLDDIAVDIWAKAMFVTTTGELGALADQPIGYLRSKLREQLEALMREVETVGRSVGVDLPDDIVEKNFHFVDQQTESATSSMQRDIGDGKPNELDSQVGAICRMGQRGGVATPLHDLVFGALKVRSNNS